MVSVSRRPGQGRYAHVEREQRWIAASVPADAVRTASILDRYIVGTRLRLRRVATPGETLLKLGQKVRIDVQDPEVVKLTNVYLSEQEYEVLAALPAAELSKTRWEIPWQGRTVAIDQFHGRLDGLVLAEVELSPDDVHLELPAFATRDVTNDDRFSGGALASATDASIAELLRVATTVSDAD